MTATTLQPAINVLPSKKTPIILTVIAVITFFSFGLLGNDQAAHFTLNSAGDAFELPELVFPGRITNIVFGVLLLAIAAYSWMQRKQGKALATWMIAVAAILFVLGFLVWVVSGANINSISLASLLAGGVVLAVPLVFGSLSGVLSERAGVVNIAIEGQLLGGAFTAAIVASVTQNAFAGLIAAGLAGAVVSLVLALFSIKYVVNQIIVGVVLNVLVSGITGFLFTTVMQEDPELFNSPVHLPVIEIPLLSAIPVIGPILFKQTRNGFNNRPFKILKFRSMRVMENGQFVRQASRGDDRVTRVGRWIRKLSVDELPQLWNVLRGEMSIVGPRPHAMAHDEHYERLIGDYPYRQHVKPGLTGWAQVRHSYGASVEDALQKLQYDLFYIKHLSIAFDLFVALETFKTVLVRRGS